MFINRYTKISKLLSGKLSTPETPTSTPTKPATRRERGGPKVVHEPLNKVVKMEVTVLCINENVVGLSLPRGFDSLGDSTVFGVKNSKV